MSNVESIFPASDFSVVAEEAGKEIKVGLILGYDKDGELCVYGGGVIGHRQPVGPDWLWMIEHFKSNLLNGEYAPGNILE